MLFADAETTFHVVCQAALCWSCPGAAAVWSDTTHTGVCEAATAVVHDFPVLSCFISSSGMTLRKHELSKLLLNDQDSGQNIVLVIQAAIA